MAVVIQVYFLCLVRSESISASTNFAGVPCDQRQDLEAEAGSRGMSVSSLGSCEHGLKRKKPIPYPGAPVGDWPLYLIIYNSIGKHVQSQTQALSR